MFHSLTFSVRTTTTIVVRESDVYIYIISHSHRPLLSRTLFRFLLSCFYHSDSIFIFYILFHLFLSFNFCSHSLFCALIIWAMRWVTIEKVRSPKIICLWYTNVFGLAKNRLFASRKIQAQCTTNQTLHSQ